MSRRKSYKTIYNQHQYSRQHSVANFVTDAGGTELFHDGSSQLRAEDTYILYGISFQLTTGSGSFENPRFFLNSQTDINGTAPYKIFPFGASEDISFKDLGDGTTLYDTQFVHPIIIPRGYYISLRFVTDSVTDDPILTADLNYVLETS